MWLKGKLGTSQGSCSWVWVCVCLLGWWPAATRLHVHCPTAGVEVRWVGLSGKWPQRGATRLVEHSSSKWVPMFPSLLSGRDSKAVVFLTDAYNVIHIRTDFISQNLVFHAEPTTAKAKNIMIWKYQVVCTDLCLCAGNNEPIIFWPSKFKAKVIRNSQNSYSIQL